jgi:TrkA domain protein
MMEVKETRLPGVGTKFAMRTARGERLVAIVHLDGMREVSHTVGDQEAHTITLNDEEARQLGAILVGAVYRPQLVDDLELAVRDLVLEWVAILPESPLVGLTVATCRIRSTTGATIVAILRDEDSVAVPHPEEVLRAGDTLVVVGKPETMGQVRRLAAEGPVAA